MGADILVKKKKVKKVYRLGVRKCVMRDVTYGCQRGTTVKDRPYQ